MLLHVLAAGVFAAALPTGLLLAIAVGAPNAEQRALAPALGVAALSMPLGLSAAFGAYSPAVLGALGWLLAIAAATILHRRRTSRSWPGDPVIRWAITGLLALAAGLYLAYPNESLLGGRDEGLYTLGGLALERSGTLNLALPAAFAAAGALAAPWFDQGPVFLPGLFLGTNGIEFRFPALLPAWIAQAHATIGDAGLYRVNALFAIAAAACFHRLARRFVREPVALVATAVFALNPAQIWIARGNLSEPLAQLLLLAALVVLTGPRPLARGQRIAAAALAAVAAFARLDAVALPLLMLVASALLALQGRARSTARMAWLRAGLAIALGQAIALALLYATNRSYLLDNLQPLAFAARAGAIALGAAIILPRVLPRGLPPAAQRAGAIGAVLALLILFVYAAWLRPQLEPFALIDRPGSGLHGLRDFRERSLANLAAYLGWATLWLALAGSCVAAWRTLPEGRHSRSLWLALVGPAVLVGMLANPRVSPDHIWAVRRFVPLAIPFAVLLAAYGLQAALTAFWIPRKRLVATALGAALVITLLAGQRATLFVAENAGLTRQLRDLDAKLGNGLVLVRDIESIGTTLALGFGRTVLPWRDQPSSSEPDQRAFLASCARLHCTLLHSTFGGLGGLALGSSRSIALDRAFIAPTTAPPAVLMASERTVVSLTAIDGLLPGTPPSNAGVPRDFRDLERGLYRDEIGPAATSRWTAGNAELPVPRGTGDILELRLAVAPPQARKVTIRVGTEVVHSGPMAPGDHVVRAALAGANSGPARIVIESDTFVPERLGLGADRRELGVVVRAVRRIDSRVASMTSKSPDDDYRSEIELVNADRGPPLVVIREGPSPPTLMLRIIHRGATAWPALPADGQPQVTLGLRWRTPNTGATIAEQRVALPYSLHPGETWWLAPTLGPQLPAALAAGEYDLEIGLVQEGVAWFVDRGDRSLRLRTRIEPKGS
jgi:hypothetical protein